MAMVKKALYINKIMKNCMQSMNTIKIYYAAKT